MKTLREANLPLTNNEAIQNMLKGNIDDQSIPIWYCILAMYFYLISNQ